MRRLACAVVSAFAFAACGGSSTVDGGQGSDAGNHGGQDSGSQQQDSGSPPASLPLDQFCPAILNGLLTGDTSTSCATLYTAQDLQHLDTASVWSELGCDGGDLGVILSPLLASVASGNVHYDGVRAAQCMAAGLDAGPNINVAFLDGGLEQLCLGTFTGAVTQGQPCARNEECVDGLYCLPTNGASCSGMCVPRLAAGTPCHPDVDLCDLGTAAVCATQPDGGSPVCQQPSGPGGPCTNNVPCQTGLTCSGGQCYAPTLTLGSACHVLGFSGSDCLPGLQCVSPNDGGTSLGVCVAAPGAGDPCDSYGNDGTGLGNCAGCYRCTAPDGGGASVGTCVVPAGEGGSCTAYTSCIQGASCLITDGGVVGVCTREARPGETCYAASPNPQSSVGNCMWADTFCSRSDGDAGIGVCVSVTGTLGEPCGNSPNQSPDCIYPALCDYDAGHCTLAPTAGQPCALTPSGQICASGLFCNSGTCTAFAATGQACSPGNLCAVGGYCDGGQCVAQVAAGATCTASQECATGYCSPGTGTCDSNCTANYPPQESGCTQGLKTIAVYLVFGAVFAVSRRRRRR